MASELSEAETFEGFTRSDFVHEKMKVEIKRRMINCFMGLCFCKCKEQNQTVKKIYMGIQLRCATNESLI